MHGLNVLKPWFTRGLLLLVLAVPTPRAGSEPPDSAQGEAVAVGNGMLTTLTTVETREIDPESGAATGRRFVAADLIRAGDEVYYTIRVTNPGREAVQGVMVTKRLPFGMKYLRGSAVGPAAAVHFSVDSGESFAAAADLRIEPPGQPGRRAEAQDYTHVRWILERPLAPGATALLRFRATLG
jgi:uncharacterized repeat protein (TIGR01451 family)